METNKLSLHEILCRVYKYGIAIGVLSILLLLIVGIFMVIIGKGREEVPSWLYIWPMFSLFIFVFSGIIAVIAHFKDINKFICD